jgi:hypothetical protein
MVAGRRLSPMLMACNLMNLGPHGLMPSLRGICLAQAGVGAMGVIPSSSKSQGAVRRFDTVPICLSRLVGEPTQSQSQTRKMHIPRARPGRQLPRPNVLQIEEQCGVGLPWQCTCNLEFIQMNPT